MILIETYFECVILILYKIWILQRRLKEFVYKNIGKKHKKKIIYYTEKVKIYYALDELLFNYFFN